MVFGAHIEVPVIEWEQVDVMKDETVELLIGRSVEFLIGRSVKLLLADRLISTYPAFCSIPLLNLSGFTFAFHE